MKHFFVRTIVVVIFACNSGQARSPSPSKSGELATRRRSALAVVASLLDDETRCRDLGSFQAGPPFQHDKQRPISVVPKCETLDRVGLFLNTRANAIHTQVLDPYDENTIVRSNLDPKKPIKILIHGFLDSYNETSWRHLARSFLEYEDCNVIRVNWGSTPPYYQATANTRLVGAYVGKLILVLKEKFGLDISLVHIIGHSLGAHTAGYAGTFVADHTNGQQIGRITGLDPAGPYFTNMPEIVRLDPSDAKVVDTIISDGEETLNDGMTPAFGSPQSMGHINFRPNGGFNQPGCNRNILQKQDDTGSASLTARKLALSPINLITSVAEGIIRCNHPRALLLFRESLNRSLPLMKAFECHSFSSFLAGECFSCQGGRCSTVGYPADLSVAEGNMAKDFFFTTMKQSPFATSIYDAVFSLSAADSTGKKIDTKHRGKVYLILRGKNAETGRKPITKSAIDLVPGSMHSWVFDVKEDLGELLSVKFFWEKEGGLLSTISGLFSGKKHLHVESDIRLADQNGRTNVFRLASTDVQEGTEVEATRVL